jgi:hypothetical protein
VPEDGVAVRAAPFDAIELELGAPTSRVDYVEVAA